MRTPATGLRAPAEFTLAAEATGGVPANHNGQDLLLRLA
jgi:hypothetical protein